MKRIGVFEGKTHFSALIDSAEHGEQTSITRNRKPVARIVPVDVSQPREFKIDDGRDRGISGTWPLLRDQSATPVATPAIIGA